MSKPNYAQMSAGVIDESLKELGIVSENVTTVPAKVQLLVRYFKAQKATLADCTVCSGASDENYRRCPYCGDAELIDPEDAASGAAVAAVATNIIQNASGGAKADKPKREKKGLALVPPVEALVPPELGNPELQEPDPQYTVKDLDKAIKQAQQHGAKAAKEVWAYGQQILDIFSKALWRLRKGEDGTAAYGSFNLFCKGELGISHTKAYVAMGLAKTYDAETVAQFGASKLSLTLNQPEDERKAMLDSIKGGASKRDIEKMRVNNAGSRELPDPEAQPTAQQIKKASEVAVMVRAPKAVEIALLGLNTKGKPATQLSDEPWGEEEHENGVISRYAIRTDPDTGAISLVITRRRVAAN